jgi:hypothetical protein
MSNKYSRNGEKGSLEDRGAGSGGEMSDNNAHKNKNEKWILIWI